MSYLRTQFVNSYRGRTVRWGFASGPNYLGELVYRRTYRRGTEEWRDTVERVVEGTFELIQQHHHAAGLPFCEAAHRLLAEAMYERIFSFKFLPPGRGLWLMGTDSLRTRQIGAGLNNCGFVSTKNIAVEPDRPFRFLMDMSMLGVGVGFDVRGAGQLTWSPSGREGKVWTITDDREGWVEATAGILRWAFGHGPRPCYDYSGIREAGSPIRGFGGTASGSGPLIQLHETLYDLATRRAGQTLSSRDIVDVMNHIGVCVVAGNVRRTAEIVFGEPEDLEYLDLKDYEKNPDRGAFGWTSNNSVFARVGMNYHACAERTRKNGEPGYAWLDNMRAYGRMIDPANWKDRRVEGGNPCLEQSLEDEELCNLVEQFPFHHESLTDFRLTAKLAWLYAKAVSLVPTHWETTNAIIARNRRIGASLSGIAQFLHHRGDEELLRWCDKTYHSICDYDRGLSAAWGINESIKKTSVKPSGSVSLLAGATPGCHWSPMNTYIRRVRYAADHPDVQSLRDAGYHVEPAIVGFEDYPENTRPVYDYRTMVVECPIDAGPDAPPTEREVSLRTKVGLASQLQRWWADNQVSCTATFLPEEGCQIESLLREYDRSLKGISFLPLKDNLPYPQMPYEAITRAEYQRRVANLRPVIWPQADTHMEEERGCDGGACELTGSPSSPG